MNPLIGQSLIQGAAGLLGSLFGGLSSNKATNQNNEANLQIARETNRNAYQIAERNNALQLKALRENNAFNRQQAIDMFNMEAAYNSPVAQKERILAAGLNPATMYGASSQLAGSASASTPSAGASGISPSMPSLVTPHMETPPTVLGTMFQNLDVVSRAFSNLAKSDLDKATKKRMQAMLNAELSNLISDTKSKEANAAWQELQNGFERVFGFAQRDAKLRNLVIDTWKLYQDGLLAQLRGDSEKADKLLKEANERLSNTNNELLKAQFPALIRQAEETANLLKEEQKTERAKQSAEYASANASNTQADVNKATKKLRIYEGMLTNEQAYQLYSMRADNVSANHYKTEDLWNTWFKNRHSLSGVLRKLELDNEISSEQAKYLRDMMEKVRNENDTFYMRTFLNVFADIVNSLK